MLKKRSRVKYLFLFFTFVILFNCTHTSSVSILYTGKSNGIIENCNCPKNKYGGLLNRLFLFDQLKDSINLILDAGDIFSFRKDNDLNQIILKILPEFKYRYEFDFFQGPLTTVVSNFYPLDFLEQFFPKEVAVK